MFVKAQGINGKPLFINTDLVLFLEERKNGNVAIFYGTDKCILITGTLNDFEKNLKLAELEARK